MSADAVRTPLYRSANIGVEAAEFGTKQAIFVGFSPYNMPAERFGEAVFAKYRLNAIFVTARGPHWFQYADAPQAAMAIRRACAGYRRVITIGVSMGGYAALAFSGLLEPDIVLAFSPQFSIDRDKVPFERRWAKEARQIDADQGFVFDDMALCRRSRIIVISDPLGRDRKHVALIAARRPVEQLKLPLTGHKSLKIMAEMRLSSQFLRAAAAGDLDLAGFRRRFRERRADSPTYLRQTAKALQRRRAYVPGTLLRRITELEQVQAAADDRKLAAAPEDAARDARDFLRDLASPGFRGGRRLAGQFAKLVPAILRDGLQAEALAAIGAFGQGTGRRVRLAEAMRQALLAEGAEAPKLHRYA
jgi:hypothetical protein